MNRIWSRIEGTKEEKKKCVGFWNDRFISLFWENCISYHCDTNRFFRKNRRLNRKTKKLFSFFHSNRQPKDYYRRLQTVYTNFKKKYTKISYQLCFEQPCHSLFIPMKRFDERFFGVIDQKCCKWGRFIVRFVFGTLVLFIWLLLLFLLVSFTYSFLCQFSFIRYRFSSLKFTASNSDDAMPCIRMYNCIFVYMLWTRIKSERYWGACICMKNECDSCNEHVYLVETPQ